ncbi:alpha/beta hydrolase [Amycolatopsis rhizosphaerae]|uniref:Alpha/beta hydrolase n=1 Tax=Amycolatopsis rhizosphaerae TaxID=2053003 RepID=A0A558BTC7_9PSEU|nr:alpha/beta hydrolase [Amycolatopsis rhizosphaerae]TVT39780.1 alpha/beta hydrolase [Amycolatopsis rhizosphaerae]
MTKTYVLIPGMWLGAWAWRGVTEDLRARGHEVHPLSLTGLGERVHLARPETDLEVHVEDVLNLMRFEDLHDVVLVGHSYAGAVVITSAADRAPERVKKLVFVDTGPLPDGTSQAEFGSPEDRARNAELVASAGEGWKLPPLPWAEVAAAVPDLDPALLKALEERSVPHPWATATSPVHLTGAWEKLPRLGILSSFTAEQARAMAAMPLFRHMADEQWEFAELPTWHWPMLDKPAELAHILDQQG